MRREERPSSKVLEMLRKANLKYPKVLKCVWRDGVAIVDGVPRPVPIGGHVPIAVWRSRDFLVQVMQVRPTVLWLCVNRTEMVNGKWRDGITWEELQRLKSECGYGSKDAVEVYPRDEDVVNVANMRHLWVFTEQLVEFAWRNEKPRVEVAGG